MSCGCDNNKPNRCAVTGATVTRVLRCDGRFCTLLRLLEQTGLDKMLDTATSITLFAPTDEAFDKLSSATMCCLCKHPKKLEELLLTQVLDGGRTLSQLAMAPPQKWTTLSGAEITVDFRTNPSRAVVIDPLNRCATIIDPNRKACNAVIQVTNAVLFPKEMCCVSAAATNCCGEACQCIPRTLGAPVEANAAQAAAASAQNGSGCGCRK
jgi:uncharacterized surface protein with fasciclin (FAS1) repeats